MVMTFSERLALSENRVRRVVARRKRRKMHWKPDVSGIAFSSGDLRLQ